MANPDVIDLSHHNPDPDWSKVRQAGVVGVIFKATEGTSYKDPTLFNRAAGAIGAGLKVSTYHFLRPKPTKAQMDHYLGTIDPVPGERICLDHEDAGVSLADLEAAVRYVRTARPDLQITIYSGHLIKEQLGTRENKFLSENTSLWIAHYTTAKAPKWPKQVWPQWSLWQYTDNAKVDGIAKPVDGNRWNGSPANLLTWFGPAAVAPPEPIIEVAITVPEGMQVKVTVNGKPHA